MSANPDTGTTKLVTKLVTGMVTNLNIALDDDVAERAREVKEQRGLTWAGYIEEAAGVLADAEAGGGLEGPETAAVDVEEAVAELDVPGSGETAEARRETVQRLYDYLRKNETARKADFLELVDADAVGYTDADSFWANSIKGRDTLRALPGVRPPEEGGRSWQYNEPKK